VTATTSPNPAEGPLAGLRVLEMGSTVAGPFCGRLLADFGAEVVKIEDPAGDPVRTMGKRFHGKSLYAASIFRNKALLALDLRQTRGREIARDMAQRADVLIENFRPGSLESWGLGYEQLSAVNPGLVMVRISGFGQDGPYSQRAGYGVIGEALSGGPRTQRARPGGGRSAVRERLQLHGALDPSLRQDRLRRQPLRVAPAGIDPQQPLPYG